MQPFDPQSAGFTVFIGIGFLATTLGSIASIVIGIIALRRRTPPLAEELYQSFVRKPDLERLESQIERRVAAVSGEVRGLASRESIEKSESRISLELNQFVARYEKTVAEIFSTLRALGEAQREAMATSSQTIGKTFQDIHLIIGIQQGKLDAHINGERPK